MILTTTDYFKEQVIAAIPEQAEHRHPTIPDHLQDLQGLPGLLGIPEVLPERLLAVLRDEEEGSGAAVLTDIPDIRGIRVTKKEVLCRIKKNTYPKWDGII